MKILLLIIFVFWIGYRQGKDIERQNAKLRLNSKINTIISNLNKRDIELNKINK